MPATSRRSVAALTPVPSERASSLWMAAATACGSRVRSAAGPPGPPDAAAAGSTRALAAAGAEHGGAERAARAEGVAEAGQPGEPVAAVGAAVSREPVADQRGGDAMPRAEAAVGRIDQPGRLVEGRAGVVDERDRQAARRGRPFTGLGRAAQPAGERQQLFGVDRALDRRWC